MVGAGTGTDVMASGADAAGSVPDDWHQPPGISSSKKNGYPNMKRRILGFPRISGKNTKKHQNIKRYTGYP